MFFLVSKFLDFITTVFFLSPLPPLQKNKIITNLEPFSQANAARSVHSDNIVSYIKQAFIKTNEILSDQYPLESIMNIRNN